MRQWTEWLKATIADLGSSEEGVAFQAEVRLLQSVERRLRAHQEMVDRLIEATAHPDPQIRWRAAYVLAATHDPRAYPRLAELVHDPDPDVRYETILAFGTFGYAEAVGLLIAILGQEQQDELIESAAAMSIQHLGRPAVAPLIELLRHSNARVRDLAASVLGYIGDGEAIEPLTALLQDPIEWVRSTAAEALEEIGAGRPDG